MGAFQGPHWPHLILSTQMWLRRISLRRAHWGTAASVKPWNPSGQESASLPGASLLRPTAWTLCKAAVLTPGRALPGTAEKNALF